ncbi:glycosyltransferase family 39 protein [Campylobacter upsaliensis]|nr:glycosyltransferase family 39 protein [Campylobacter upsaliensis]
MMRRILGFKFVFLILFVDLVALLYGISTLSISEDEAEIYFNSSSLLYYFTHFGTLLFGQNDFGLRFAFLLFHFLSCILLFLLALKYTKKMSDSIFSLLLFILLPGTVASALLVNEASFVILLSLALLCAYEYDKRWLFYPLFVLVLFVDKSFSILFLTFFFFGIYKKNGFLSIFSLTLFVLSVFYYGFDTGGRPKGYFLDTLGIFAACFSPLVFVYFFYVIYRLAFKKDKSLLWFLMTTTFLFCSLLSLRQKLYLEDFLPFCVICTPLLIKTLMQSYRVRLPKFRLKYKIFIECAGIFLLFCYFIIVANHILYSFIDEPKKHFAYNYHLAKELSKELKKEGITTLRVAEDLQKRLEFYGIKNSDFYYLKALKKGESLDPKLKTIQFSFGKHRKIYQIKSFEREKSL